MTNEKLEINLAGRVLSIETGKLATLADGSITIRYGDTVVLATVVATDKPKEGAEFFPMMVDYEERLYAAGKISTSRFIKREGRPSDNAILACRLIDRPLRPLFPKNYYNDVQIVITVLSVDLKNDPEIISIIAASAALLQSSAPFEKPVGAVRVGYVDGQFIANPTADQLEKSQLDMVVAGTEEKVMMIEAKANQLPEKEMFKAIEFGQKELIPTIKLQEKLLKEIKKTKVDENATAPILSEVEKYLGTKIYKAIREADKEKREEQLEQFELEILENFEGNYKQVDLKTVFGQLVENEVRKAILDDGLRPDGRKLDEIRPINIEIGVLPRTHGSALFTRGQTQALSIVTLGAPGEEQVIETMEEETTKRYMHHYNFPPFSTGEVRSMRSTSRREIGHGVLAEKALSPVIPSKEEFAYTIRVVSEILSSNGSSSMASTCGSSLALMDAGVPIKDAVAGISMGLVKAKEPSKGKKPYVLLTDIQGLEDFAGDMDFKVAGTKTGITAIQLDIKIDGLDLEIIKAALEQAQKARLQVLEKMNKVISAPRAELSLYAPRIEKIMIPVSKIGDVIGPGGKMIRSLIEDAGGKEVISIDIEEDGTVLISSVSEEATKIAKDKIEGMTKVVTVGETFTGEVVSIVKDRRTGGEIGAIVKISPYQEGMVHISQLADYRVGKVTDIVKIGEKIPVKVMAVDPERHRISLSFKEAKNSQNKPEGPLPIEKR